MDKLENDVNSFMDDLNQEWVKEAETSRKEKKHLNVTKVFGNYSEIMKKVKSAFIEARKRNTKKGFFG